MTFSLSSLPIAAQSPRTQMNARISAAVSAGSISSTDQTALSTALDSIDSTLAGAKPAGATSSMKDRIDSLVDQQVTAGTLTDDQASELKQLFAQGAPTSGPDAAGSSDDDADGIAATGGTRGPGGPGSAGGPGGPGGARGPGGPPPGPPPSDDDTDSDDTTTSTTSTATDATATSAIDQRLAAMEKFLDKLRQSIDASGTYDSSKSAASAGTVFSGIA